MVVGVCIGCVELFEGARLCPRCGAKLSQSRSDVIAWEHARQHARIKEWLDDEVIDHLTAERLRARLERDAVKADEPVTSRETTVERGADVVASGAGELYAEMAGRWKRLAKAIDEDTPKHEEGQSLQHDDRTLEAGRAIFARDGGGAVVGAGVEALAGLDEDDPAEGLHEENEPVGALQVFWFIGTLFVLAGSVMGVREAWRTLEGVWRPVVIAGAFFGYHVLFVGLARLLVRRSFVTGRVLSGISAGLLPVVFVAAAVSIGQQSAVGVPFAFLLLAASGFTLMLVGRIADRAATGVALAAGLLPSLLLELAIGSGGAAPSRRALVVLVALLPLVVAATRARLAVTASSVVALGAAAYGAVAVGILGLYGGPGDPSLSFDSGGIGQRALILWIAAWAAIAWWTSTGPAVTTRLTRIAAVPHVLALAVLVSTSAAALVVGLSQDGASRALDAVGGLGLAIHVPLVVMVLTAAVLVLEQRARPGALHVAVLVSLGMTLLVGKTLFPERAELWPSTCAAVPAGFLLLGAFVSDRRRRVILATWGIVAAIGTLLTTLGVEAATRTSADDGRSWKVTAYTALALALSAHVGARTSRPSLHLAGAGFAFVAMLAWFLPLAPPLLTDASWAHTFMFGCAGLAAAYGVLALGYEAIAPKDDDRRPLDDASLMLASGAVWLSILFAPRAPRGDVPIAWVRSAELSTIREIWVPATPGIPVSRAWFAAPVAALAIVLFVRALRDRSALVVAQAAIAVALAVWVFVGASDAVDTAWLAGLLAGAFAVLASFRAPRAESAPKFGRAIYGIVPLPLSGSPRTLLDGFALVALPLVVISLLAGGSSLSGIDEGARIVVLAGLGGILCAALAAFTTRSFERFHARGNVVTLWLAAPVIGLTAVAYRIGRPLAPDVVGFRLSIVIALVWLLARGIVKVGPRLGAALGRPQDGPRYHHVAHFGVVALALLLFVDAVLVGGPTPTRSIAVVPPLLLAGSALGFLLLYRSYGREALLHFGLILASFASLLGFAQRSLTGPALVPLDLPGGRWVPLPTAESARLDWLDPARFLLPGDTELAIWNRGWLGLAIAATALAAMLALVSRSPAFATTLRSTLLARREDEAPAIERGIFVPLAISSALLALGLAFQPSLPAAVAFALAGVLAATALSPRHRAVPLVLGAPMLVHAFAQSGALVPAWAGPAIALLALVAVALGRRVSEARVRDPKVLAETQLVALAYAPLAIAYALAAGGATSATNAAPSVVELAARALDGVWVVSYAPALTFALLAAASTVAGLAWRGGLAKLLLVAPPLLLAVAAACFAAAFTRTTGASGLVMLVSRNGPLLGASLAVAATISHVTAFSSARARRDDAALGLSYGRDAVLVASSLVMCLFVATRETGGFMEGPCGIAALGLSVAVALHAVAWQGTARHVALVEALLVAFYAFATRSFGLRPEVDAMIGLLYGFSLIGVAVVARRRKVPAVADATRRFAGALPILLVVLTTSGASNGAAGLALGASLLYGTMAWVERSRVFGSLAALAANLALIVFAVAQGLDGAEVFIGPLGIFVTALAQIFAPKMTPSSRTALRIIGGALLYLPAGLKLTFRLGAAEEGSYSVVFGVVCIVGVLAGLVLQVRAYLALGTLFLTLDILANLVHAGLRDHRVGFVLLSVSGLGILGIMIGITLRRDWAWGIGRRIRARLGAWD